MTDEYHKRNGCCGVMIITHPAALVNPDLANHWNGPCGGVTCKKLKSNLTISPTAAPAGALGPTNTYVAIHPSIPLLPSWHEGSTTNNNK
jgi:hypothetical protein